MKIEAVYVSKLHAVISQKTLILIIPCLSVPQFCFTYLWACHCINRWAGGLCGAETLLQIITFLRSSFFWDVMQTRLVVSCWDNLSVPSSRPRLVPFEYSGM
jgi:hypothetical protein